MPTSFEPNELDARRRKQDAKEAAERAAEHERRAIEAQENSTYAAVVAHLQQTGRSFDVAELAAELDNQEHETIRHALERGIKAGTLTESYGRYGAVQH